MTMKRMAQSSTINQSIFQPVFQTNLIYKLFLKKRTIIEANSNQIDVLFNKSFEGAFINDVTQFLDRGFHPKLCSIIQRPMQHWQRWPYDVIIECSTIMSIWWRHVSVSSRQLSDECSAHFEKFHRLMTGQLLKSKKWRLKARKHLPFTHSNAENA